MKYYLKLSFVLLVITLIAGSLLALINQKTAPIIIENQRLAKIEARKEVLPQAKEFEKIVDEKLNYYIAKDSKGKKIGYTFVASKYGYSGDVETMVGLKNDYSINSIKILKQSETPGLGANCASEDFKAKFVGKKLENLKVDKDGGDIVSITGATITTRTVTNSINEKINILKKIKGAK